MYFIKQEYCCTVHGNCMCVGNIYFFSVDFIYYYASCNDLKVNKTLRINVHYMNKMCDERRNFLQQET